MMTNAELRAHVRTLAEQLPAFSGSSLLVWRTGSHVAALWKDNVCLLSCAGTSEAAVLTAMAAKIERYVATRAA